MWPFTKTKKTKGKFKRYIMVKGNEWMLHVPGAEQKELISPYRDIIGDLIFRETICDEDILYLADLTESWPHSGIEYSYNRWKKMKKKE